MLSNVVKHLSNIPGWRTKRKIVVIESDDWGSIRMPSIDVYNNILKSGLKENNNRYNVFDALESNKDLELLFELLSEIKDYSGRSPILTTANIVANPDFDKVKKSGFKEYYYEPFIATLEQYPEHDRVYELWKIGIKEGYVYPVFHGREHLNVQRWLKALQSNNKKVQIAFNNKLTGITPDAINNIPDLQAAFNIDSLADIPFQKNALIEGLDLFEQMFDYRSQYFIPPNGPLNNSLEKTLFECGVKFINTNKIQKEPLGNNTYKTNICFLGKQNSFRQTYITRNCFFEPTSMGTNGGKNAVDNCLKDIKNAFTWNKPAIISSHRVNYIGFLHPENRDASLKLLKELLVRIMTKWPNVEFLTSVELGELVSNHTSNEILA